MFIKDMTDTSQRVAELFDYLQKGDKRRFEDFCTALENNSQKYIVDLLCCSQAGGDRKDAVPHDADDMPLSRKDSCKLTACWNSLIDQIEGGPALQAHLESLQVFSDLQLKKLKASSLNFYAKSLNLVYKSCLCFLLQGY